MDFTRGMRTGRRDGKPCCPVCREEMEVGAAPHPVFIRVVRQGQRYGEHRGGDRVEVEVRHMNDAVQMATMSLEEHEMLLAAATKPKVVEKPAPQLLQLVQRNMDAQIAATTRSIEAGKRAVERAAQRAVDQAVNLFNGKPPRSSDLEQPSVPTHAVKEAG